MTLVMVHGVEADGELDSTMSILQCTGESTGSSLAFVCAVKGYKFTVIHPMPGRRSYLEEHEMIAGYAVVIQSGEAPEIYRRSYWDAFWSIDH